jgi:hypothetical protein
VKCILEVYNDEDYEEDEFLSQESKLLGTMYHFSVPDHFDD